MRIGILVDNLAVSGGYQKLVLQLATILASNGDDIVIYATSVNYQKCYPTLLKKTRIILPNLYKLTAILPQSIRNIVRLWQIVCQIDKSTETIIVNDELTLTSLGFRKIGSKIVWMVNNPLSDKFSQLLSVSWHDLIFSCKIPDLIHKYLVVRAISQISVATTYDRYNADVIHAKTGLPAKVVYAGADKNNLSKSRNSRQSNHTLNLLSIGIMYPYRRYEDIIEAVHILKKKYTISVSLSIVGVSSSAPGYLEDLRSMINKKGLNNNIHFIEYASPNELKKVLSKTDIYIFVNNGGTWGVSVIEAINSSIPTIITNNIGVSEILEHGRETLQVDPCSPNQISQSILKIQNDKKLRLSLVSQAKVKVKTFLSWESYANRMKSVIMSLE